MDYSDVLAELLSALPKLASDLQVDVKTGLDCSGMKNMNDKPGSTKAKFSSITGPDIYYDGKSHKGLLDC